jgi:hemolysin activation/secretion protein
MLRFDHSGTATRWKVGADGLLGEGIFATRIWGDAEQRLRFLRLHLGAGYADRAAPPQLLLRAGGPRTVRGHQFGVQAGRAMWAAQLEVMVPRNGLKPFVFADAGAAAAPDQVFTAEPLLGVGGGLSLNLLIAELRLEVAQSIGHTRVDGVRVDLLLRATR